MLQNGKGVPFLGLKQPECESIFLHIMQELRFMELFLHSLLPLCFVNHEGCICTIFLVVSLATFKLIPEETAEIHFIL